MAFRKRDSAPRSAYSSADAYRSLPAAATPSHAHAHATRSAALPPSSSSDEDHLTSPSLSPTTPHVPIAQSFLRARTRSRRDSETEPAPDGGAPPHPGVSPLAPPRPLFHDNRRSWSASSGASSSAPEPEPGSDSDNSAGLAGVGARPLAGARPPSYVSPVAAAGPGPAPRAARTRNHRRRSSMANEYTATSGPSADEAGAEPVSPQATVSEEGSNPFADTSVRSPPSAYPFPFQSHPGNPDPGTHIPGVSRRASTESMRLRSAASAAAPLISPGSALSPPNSSAGTTYPAGYGLVRVASDAEELGRPYAPFMEGGSIREGSQSRDSSLGHSASQSQLYRDSAAGAMASPGVANESGLPRKASNPNFQMRAPFLSPASRPGSSLWSPPSFPYPYPPASASFTGLSGTQTPTHGYDLHAQLRKARPPMASTFLPEKLTKEDKPWMLEKDRSGRISWWLTFLFMWIGIGGAAVYIYFGYTSVLLLKDSDLCSVLDEEFNSLDLNSTWTAEVEMGGFGNGEFQMATTKSKNLYVNNGQLYIVPTLTSDEIGEGSVIDGYTYPLAGCTTSNQSACTATSSSDDGTVIPPVQAARISTRNSVSIKYGRVEVRAKLPRGDWLWPAIWMLPVNNTYGVWPLSGEIDLMEARGNGPEYGAQGVNYVRSSLNYGPLDTLITQIFGWWSVKHSTYADDFHTYRLEWTPKFIRLSVDSRIHDMLQLRITGRSSKSFWQRGSYPATAQNGSATEVVVDNIWADLDGTPAAPFDQNFYLILDVAAGGTSGWFPDNVGGKPWYDKSGTAMREFATAQSTWSATWPSDDDDRGFRVDSVKMWNLGAC